MRKEKLSVVKNIEGWLQSSPYLIVTDYTGLKVDQFSELRNRLAAVSGEIHVVKNTYIRRALKEARLPELDEKELQGQTAVVCGAKDFAAAAKVLKNFKAEFQKPDIRIGIVDKAVMAQDMLLTIADLPSLEALRTKLVILINTPATQLAQIIKAKLEKDGGGAPAEAEASADAASAEAKTE
ncbi:MAG: 50S ribosomal protein L10 [Verrucomicrobiales bacterium]|jgi:large subunit ribosomal protein L10|nr:50S ribosomal protein L10 [Verrucomicrobiales bacterium]